MLIDTFLPTYDFHEVHHISIAASPEQVFQAIKTVTPEELPGVQLLFALRALPARLMSQHAYARSKGRTVLGQLLRGGFLLLGEEQGREMVVGTIGQFWKIAPVRSAPRVKSAEEFLAFTAPNYAKAVMNFSLTARADGAGSILRTETRIWTPDAATRRAFARYWLLIFGGSTLIRRLWLRAIKRRAEHLHAIPIVY